MRPKGKKKKSFDFIENKNLNRIVENLHPEDKIITPSKIKKQIWEKCENCQCILNPKENRHAEYCSLEKSQWPFDFIEKKNLNGTIKNLIPKEIPSHLRLELAKECVFVSHSAMQLCEITIGDHVLIETNNYRTIMKVWPSRETRLTSVGVFLEELETRSGLKLNCPRIKVSHLESKPIFAKTVYFSVTPQIERIPSFELEATKLSKKFMKKVVHQDMILPISFFGVTVKLKIVKIEPLFEKDIIENMEELNLNLALFTIISNTVWVHQASYKASEVDKEKIIKVFGYQSLLNRLIQNIEYTYEQKYRLYRSRSFYSVLLYGPTGTGKSYIAQHLAKVTKKPFIILQGLDVLSKLKGETENRLVKIFENVKSKAPCTLIIDNIETICARCETDRQRRILSTLLSLFDSIQFFPVIVIATTVDPDVLEPALRRPGRLQDEIEIDLPNKEVRFEILSALVPCFKLSPVLEKIAENCHGFIAADLASLVDKANVIAVDRESISEEHLMQAFQLTKPSSMKGIETNVEAVKWDEIGGGEELKLKLRQAVEWPLKHGDSYKRLGIRAPKGVLLYGPPGCSKTLVTKALATETNLNFISVKSSDIFSKYVGESEKKIRQIFKSARKVAPSIIFFDELDAIGTQRGKSESCMVYDRVLSQILVEMDGIDPIQGVIIVGATNRPDFIDKALLRPGRIDTLIYVPLADYDTRLQILKIRLKKMMTKDVNVEELAEKTEHYSGAEVVEVCNRAGIAALKEDIKSTHIKMSHFLSAISEVKPRTPQSLLDLYDKYRAEKRLS